MLSSVNRENLQYLKNKKKLLFNVMLTLRSKIFYTPFYVQTLYEAGIAQLVERLTCNQEVQSSSLCTSYFYF